MREEKPHIYQVIDGKEIEVKGRYIIDTSESKDKIFAFSLEPYNPSYPLIIDPALSYSTYLGGTKMGL